MENEREDAVDKLLKAFGEAKVPEGMEARVLAGLARQAGAMGARSGWRDVVRGSTAADGWWRGAVSGAAMALLGVGLFIVVGHWGVGRSGPKADHGRARYALTDAPDAPGGPETRDSQAQSSKVQAVTPVQMRAADVAMRRCADPGISPAGKIPQVHELELVRIGGSERTYPADEPGLTAEERELVWLTRRVAAKDLASLDPEVRAQMQAEDVAEFESFFYQPPVKVNYQN